MLILQEVYEQTWFLILIAVVGILLTVFLLVVLSIAIVHSSCKRQVKDLENRYNSIHDSFSTDCSNMIKRIESISKQNATYVQIFDSVQGRFASILKDNDKQCYIAVDSLKALVGDKKYKAIRPIIDSTKASMDDFQKAATGLNNDLQNLLHPEEECCSLAVALKEKFRSLKDKYETNQTALESISNSFTILFNHITVVFEKFEEYLNSADYTSAKKLLPDAEKLIDAADKVMGDIPMLNTLTDKVVPKRIEDLNNTYHEMEKTYPLHHLMINTALDSMRERVSECRRKLERLDITGIQQTLDGISMEINHFFADFEKEKEAKIIFDNKQGDIDSSTYQCEKQQASLVNMMPSYKKYYKIDQSYINQIAAVKDMIDSMSTRKRTLDSYINSSTKQPYTMLVTTITELENQVKAIQKVFDDFHEYLKQQKADSERDFRYIKEAYSQLLEAKNKLRKLNIDAVTASFEPRIEIGEEMIYKLDKEISATPIDVMKINSDYSEAHIYIDKITDDLQETLANQSRAEDLIVYDNKLREDSFEVDRKLKVAEQAFTEGDFTRASGAAAEIYKAYTAEAK